MPVQITTYGTNGLTISQARTVLGQMVETTGNELEHLTGVYLQLEAPAPYGSRRGGHFLNSC